MENEIFIFWGKAEKDGAGFHPAVCHMLDVGIVAREILTLQPPPFRRRFTEMLGVDEKTAIDTLAFLAALHDLGKISPGFQEKRLDLCASLKTRDFSFPLATEPKHGRVVCATLPTLLMDVFGCEFEAAEALARILGAHHGIFDECGPAWEGGTMWSEARRTAAALLADVFAVQSLATVRIACVADLLLLAGLVSVADWIASDESRFPYLNGAPTDLIAYLTSRRQITTTLLHELSMGVHVEKEPPFSALFNFDKPNACQDATMSVVSKLKHPMLVVVETPMGSGKTEAAQAAYAKLAVRDGLRGMYCALPTQATGNAMFERTVPFLERLHDKQSVELHLLHANADIYPQYETMLKNVGDDNGTVSASTWFTARKRGLLAGYGTGTVDQALLAVLRVKHFFVRLFGLGGKLIVLDEVHAYDAYMSEEICALIGWIARCGSSTMLLSATLPKEKRSRLIDAFSPSAKLPENVNYPCVFGIDLEGNVAVEPVHIEPGDLDFVPLFTNKLEKITKIADKVCALASEEGCVACIVNTVGEAQQLYALLENDLPADELILFHSRFTLSRRLEIEQQLLSRFGKKSDRPRRGVVIATQVLEQSLDVCFDAMISDLAPIDLLLQRAGRLHRHNRIRPLHLQRRQLHVMLPDQRDNPDFGWSGLVYFPDLLARTAHIFDQCVESAPFKIELPRDVSPLIEQVYGNADETGLNDARERWLNERLGEQSAQSFYARAAVLPSVHDCWDDPGVLGRLQNDEFRDDERTLSTRIGRVRINLVILAEGATLEIRSRADERQFYLNSLTTDNVRLVRHFATLAPPAEWSESSLLRFYRPVHLSEGRAQIGEISIAYNGRTGMVIQQRTKEGQ